MQAPLWQIDAFTARPFAGNPAAVVLLDAWLPDEVLQNVAAENNLSETAFLVPDGSDFGLRWFTPTTEVDLCGHATLAAGWVVLARDPARARVAFHTRSGTLHVEREGQRLALDMPARPTQVPEHVPPALLAAMGPAPREVLQSARDWLLVYDRPVDVLRLEPDFTTLREVARGVIATAPAGGEDGIDFVSRFFAPAMGVDEDPVTGSSHCVLVPFWAERLGRPALSARQVSARGGDLHGTLQGDRVRLAGHAVLYLEGTLHCG